MATLRPALASPRRRDSSSSTVKAAKLPHERSRNKHVKDTLAATLWVHDDQTLTDEILIKESLLTTSTIKDGDVIEITATRVRQDRSETHDEANAAPGVGTAFEARQHEFVPRLLCIARAQSSDAKGKLINFDVSLHSRLAVTSGFRSRDTIEIRATDVATHTASHVELGFRDVYLARSDMWRMVGQELVNRFVHVGQRITFLGSVRVNVKAIHVRGHRVAAAYFSGNTVPVFRSEAARYVIFIQMSREMWGFDSEGNGEILFNRVINGFLPDLFKRWTTLEVRHLVSIVLFGRQEYNQYDVDLDTLSSRMLNKSPPKRKAYQDFYKVVVTDMASAQWTTILDELKKNFRVFLRDVSLFPPEESLDSTSDSHKQPKITGRLTTALKGNILEAINMASMQFSNDYVDRDLIRTGVSVVVVTAGAGVYEVDKDLLNLTSENLTNNGIGIDIVCLAKMPLHSVPCFKYRTNKDELPTVQPESLSSEVGDSPTSRSLIPAGLSAPTSFRGSPVLHSVNSSELHPFSQISSSTPRAFPGGWSYGIPQWIDLSYWSPTGPKSHQLFVQPGSKHNPGNQRKETFVPRVRMYEIQMIGLTEMGMADISIPWMSETQESEPKRRKHRKVYQQQFAGSRSLSHSPNISRKSIRLDSASFKGQGLLAAGQKLHRETFDKMDKYDESVFKSAALKRWLVSTDATTRAGSKPRPPTSISSQDPVTRPEAPEGSQSAAESTPHTARPASPVRSDTASITKLNKQRSPQAVKASRNASYALRGLLPPMRATASTEINVENAQAQMQKTPAPKARPQIGTNTQGIRSLSLYSNASTATTTVAPSLLGSELSPVSSNPSSDRPSTPIKIAQPQRIANGSDAVSIRDAKLRRPGADENEPPKANPANSTASSAGDSESSSSDSDGTSDILSSSVPKSVLPFIRNVNASNPLKGNPNRESFFGRWQHLYPRKPRAAIVKWRSLCTPASVPLTTEDFPSKDSMSTDYTIIRDFTVTVGNPDDLTNGPKSRDELLREMLSVRFAHGYQLVVGPRMNKFEGPGLHDVSFFFNPDAQRHAGQYLFMSMGITIQKLTLLDDKRIQVTRYQRNPLPSQDLLPKEVSYESYVRTILADNFKKQTMTISGYDEEYPWELADNYLANTKKSAESEIHTLRFWRARFVLLPVEPPANAFRPTAADSEENEEEIHLRGIRALTQAWQRMRYVPTEERRPAQNRMSAFKPKDRNPLSIKIETLNPSELVATELDKLLAAEEAGEVSMAQLLPEEEQFDRETAKLGKIATAIQGDRGIEIKNRRWHLRLHYSCFHGEDLTNWLVQNVRDIDTRDEAVEFGNELMKEGLFEHVNSRHNFKDGNFFYSIKSEWRAPRTEARQSWFPSSRKSDKSTPATPALEQTSKESASAAARGRAATSSLATALTPISSDTSRPAPERKKLAVSLSKMIRLDVDTRKRSGRPEVVNLHYDRNHSPENCYHLELSWLNVTSKLVDDAIVSWTTTAERYGLKLVEVPIVEACKVPENEPFRSAYRIKLAVPPPSQPRYQNGNGNSFFTATSFTPHEPVRTDPHYFQKALLKHFNFVLDLEGISEFPENVEINYSWGKLNYTYTQFVHRSGVILGQITKEGDILLLANRLYNSRLASAKDTTAKLETTRQLNAAAQALRPVAHAQNAAKDGQMQASGIVGINVQSPAMSSTSHALSSPSPMLRPLPRPLVPPNTGVNTTNASAMNSTASVPLAARLNSSINGAASPLTTSGGPAANTHLPTISTALAQQPESSSHHNQQQVTADVFGPWRPMPNALAQFITPEQIKDDLEKFCHDAGTLEAFYADTLAAMAQQADTTNVSAGNLTPIQSGRRSTVGSVPGTPVSNAADRDKDPASAERNKKRGSVAMTGSSLLRPVAESELDRTGSDGSGGGTSGIPEMQLPESVQGGKSGWGLGLGRKG
jgi:DEP domain-containing protein 5